MERKPIQSYSEEMSHLSRWARHQSKPALDRDSYAYPAISEFVICNPTHRSAKADTLAPNAGLILKRCDDARGRRAEKPTELCADSLTESASKWVSDPASPYRLSTRRETNIGLQCRVGRPTNRSVGRSSVVGRALAIARRSLPVAAGLHSICRLWDQAAHTFITPLWF